MDQRIGPLCLWRPVPPKLSEKVHNEILNLNIQELQNIHYGVYWCTGAFLVLGHLQP